MIFNLLSFTCNFQWQELFEKIRTDLSTKDTAAPEKLVLSEVEWIYPRRNDVLLSSAANFFEICASEFFAPDPVSQALPLRTAKLDTLQAPPGWRSLLGGAVSTISMFSLISLDL
jgi:hypothetical protein